MGRFQLAATPVDTATLRAALLDDRVGGYASFEGWVRNRNEDRDVLGPAKLLGKRGGRRDFGVA